jgi:hypothetical protein
LPAPSSSGSPPPSASRCPPRRECSRGQVWQLVDHSTCTSPVS